MVFVDETILTETPPLRASWSPCGVQARVPITGNRDKRILFGALNPKTGTLVTMGARRWNQETFQQFLGLIRRCWRGWRIVLFLDRGSPHRAKASQALAQSLGIQERWLPTACPELNPVEGLWRHLKREVLANTISPMDEALLHAQEYLLALKPHHRLSRAGVSNNFWLPT